MSFGTKEFWDLWYKNLKEASSGDTNVKPIEWYLDHQLLKSLFLSSIDKKSKILAIGCGNSTLSEQMYEDGYKNILNIDYRLKIHPF